MTTHTGRTASHTRHAAESLVRQVRSALNPSAHKSVGGGQPASGWLAVTVVCEPSALDAAQLPTPLAELGDQIEVRIQPAPDSKGTELAARLRDQRSSASAPSRLKGSDAQAGLRSRLRQAKQLIEVGEVLAVDPAPHGERPDTPPGKLLEAWTKIAPKGGVL